MGEGTNDQGALLVVAREDIPLSLNKSKGWPQLMSPIAPGQRMRLSSNTLKLGR
jgi:hypothetical protein